MAFSWKALVLAPLPVTLVLSALFIFVSPGRNIAVSILVFWLIGLVLAYGIEIFIFVPALYLLTRVVAPAAWPVGLVGTVVGYAAYLSTLWVSYHSSGRNSGPPSGRFETYLQQNAFSWECIIFLIAGLATALIYWRLARPRSPDAA
jgi:hypothetical protein